ncbi:MAG: hypothetical protein AB8B78_13620 [Polaribacter sp.]
MNLSKIKENRVRKKLNKQLLKTNTKRTVSQKEIMTVGILTLDSISSKIDLQTEIETIIGVRNTKIYSFKKFDKLDDASFKHFSEKDINWKGDFIQPNFKSFIETPFDLLIGFFNEENLYLEKAVYNSKATFKVGFSNVNSNLYEMEIHSEIENVEQFSTELKKYLKILKKLKN